MRPTWLAGLFALNCGVADSKSGDRTETAGGTELDSGTPESMDADGDGVALPEDCDDSNASVFPGAEEVCNGRDDNCNAQTDEGVLTAFYADNDGDGWGNEALMTEACEPPEGSVAVAGDCDDTDPTVHPEAVDVCNELDDDCDGETDEDGGETVYADGDGDGYGDSDTVETGCPGSGWVTLDGDCDDTDGLVSPGQPVDYCDGVDTDCDGEVDEDSKAGWSLLSVDTNAGFVYDIDPATASTSEIVGLPGGVSINSMDVSENGISVVHVNSISTIALFDACTGTWTSIGAHGGGQIGGIGFGPAGRLFGIGRNDYLYEFDLSDGQATIVGPLGIDIGTSGLAWDCSTQTMYGADGTNNLVFEVDLTTGAATNVQSTTVPFESVGLEYDRRSGLLLASTRASFYSIDPTSGASTFIGNLGGSNIDDLAWHPTCP